jgi:hypothetical protein
MYIIIRVFSVVISGQILPPPLPPSQESFDDVAPEASRCRWRFVRASLPGLSVVGAEALATWAAALVLRKQMCHGIVLGDFHGMLGYK